MDSAWLAREDDRAVAADGGHEPTYELPSMNAFEWIVRA